MTAKNNTYCPWGCRCDEDCEHFIGWTEDGRTIEFRRVYRDHCEDPAVLDTDRIVMTGTTARVYRELP